MEEFKVDGVVEVILQACHTYSVESMGIRKFVNGKGKSIYQCRNGLFYG